MAPQILDYLWTPPPHFGGFKTQKSPLNLLITRLVTLGYPSSTGYQISCTDDAVVLVLYGLDNKLESQEGKVFHLMIFMNFSLLFLALGAHYPTLENNFPLVCACVIFILHLSVRPFVTFSTHPPMCVCPFVRLSRFRPTPLCVFVRLLVRHVFYPRQKKACIMCYSSSLI